MTSGKASKKERKQDPIRKEFCPKCASYAQELIGYIRQLENAHVVGKQAIETMQNLNNKLTKEKEVLTDQNERLKSAVKGEMENRINRKKEVIERQYNRFVNRNKIV